MTSFAHQRFLIPLAALQDLLSKVKKQKDPGIAFYQGRARDILFRLEGLCRIYREIQDEKFFDTWYKEFKSLEDALGSMDHNEAMWKEFDGYKELKKASAKLFQERFIEESSFLTDVLKNNGWLSGEKLMSFSSALESMVWKDEEGDVIGYGNAMNQELSKVVKKYRKGELDISNLESGLHEFRRRLRWVSIYASAANGLVQVRVIKLIPQEIKKYCTKDIVTSPFNVMVKPAKDQKTIEIQSPHFFALSWLIQNLSQLKDTGIRNIAFNELVITAAVKDKNLRQKFLKTCKFNPDDVCALAEQTIDEFIYRDLIPDRVGRDIKRSQS